MSRRLSYAAVRETPRQVIYAVRVHDEILELPAIDDIAARMRERLAHRGELNADVVVVQGQGKETLRLFGTPYSVSRVRAAMFNAAVSWTPLELV
jgi:2-methylcitrate dehydratase PrpD